MTCVTVLNIYYNSFVYPILETPTNLIQEK